MLARNACLLALVATLGAGLFVSGCAKPATGTTCSSGQLECSGTCINVQTDGQNCGACGNTCGSGSTCQSGKCSCTNGFVSCGGSCVASNAQHCGSNCSTCSGTDVCNSDGNCSSTCSSGTKCSDGACSSPTNSADCGTCGNACTGGTTCVSGTCTCGSSSQSLCNGSCVDITTTTNCGTCGNKCGSGQTCTNRACVGGSGTGGSTGTGGSSATGGSTGTGGTSATGGSTGTGGSSATGGSTGTGGTSATGGSTGTGGTSTGAAPPGYYKTADWNVTSVDWHGCVWTGIDTVASTTTAVTPQDFTAAAKEGGPYQVSGTVFNDYNAVALLGFNLNEATTGSSTQCKYNPAAATSAGPPAATIPSSATGIAVNWSQAKAPPTSFRIQIQAADGATNAAHRWCATITGTPGKTFVPFTSFGTQCWLAATDPMAANNVKYNKEAIDAVVFLVPGTISTTAPFDFTILGFAPGTTAADAPGGAAVCGTTTETLGTA